MLLCLQVKELTKYLDPSGLGVISFEDFHRGIRAIRNGGELGAVLPMGPAVLWVLLGLTAAGRVSVHQGLLGCCPWVCLAQELP